MLLSNIENDPSHPGFTKLKPLLPSGALAARPEHEHDRQAQNDGTREDTHILAKQAGLHLEILSGTGTRSILHVFRHTSG